MYCLLMIWFDETLWGPIYYKAPITAQGLPEPSSHRDSTSVPEQLNIKAVTGSCKVIDGCSLVLCSATVSVVSAGICHRNKVNSTAWLYRKARPKIVYSTTTTTMLNLTKCNTNSKVRVQQTTFTPFLPDTASFTRPKVQSWPQLREVTISRPPREVTISRPLVKFDLKTPREVTMSRPPREVTINLKTPEKSYDVKTPERSHNLKTPERNSDLKTPSEKLRCQDPREKF